MHRVFVYGTLKRGQPNYHLLEKATSGQCEFKGEGSTVSTFPLIIASSYNIPFVLNAPNAEKAQNVRGEVYQVDDQILSNLDGLECHPDFYERTKIDVQMDKPKQEDDCRNRAHEVVQCWCYVLKDYRPELLNRQFLDLYDAEGPHGLKYVPASARNAAVGKGFWREVKLSVQNASE